MKKTLLATFCALSLSAGAADTPRTLDLVDPEYRAAAPAWLIHFDDPQVRAQFNERNAKRAAENSQPAQSLSAPADGDQPAVPLYLYTPKNSSGGKLPIIYFIHGGGYILGNAKMVGDALQALADRQQAAVVSVEYRLATAAPFPADLHDAYHGLRYIYQHATDYGLDAERVVLMGESAGGGLAARLALYTRDKGELTPEGQILIYPMLDYRTGTPESPYRDDNAGEIVWTAAANRVGWATLRGGQSIPDSELPYFSPAFATHLRGLPPTFILVGSLDLFVHEDIAYASRLIEAGVPTELHVLPGLCHAFEMANPDGAQTRRYLDWRHNAIEKMHARPVH